MASATNNWNLFGLDLARSGKWLSLGVQQLLYGRDAWLLQRFDPGLSVYNNGAASFYCGDRVSDEMGPAETGDAFQAVVLPSDTVLLKTLLLPASTEESLDSAMELEVGLSSPFTGADTRAAWRVIGRRDSMIEVTLGITAQPAIEHVLADHTASQPEANAEQPEVWALTDQGIPLPFSGFGGDKRRTAYHRQLMRAAALVAGVWLLFMASLLTLAGAAAFRADGLNATFQEVQRESAFASGQRELLQIARTRLGTIEAAIAARPNYQFWLNHIAASAPDTVYLDRLNFDGKQVSVNGYSDNAAVYLRMLTEEPGYSDVTALSAFARDRNNGLERFSIEWRVTEPLQPDDQSVTAESMADPAS